MKVHFIQPEYNLVGTGDMYGSPFDYWQESYLWSSSYNYYW